MGDSLFANSDENSLYFSRADVNQELGSFSDHPFQLEQIEWPTVEHYFQAMKFEDDSYREKVRSADSPKLARKLGRKRSQVLKADWKTAKSVYMTRAVYTKCRTYPAIAEKLLATGSRRLVENSQYDYYWGCGRDRRGQNMYGQVLMNVRDRLLEERAAE